MKNYLALFAFIVGLSGAQAAPRLEKLNLDPTQISVSGLSSGAMMAVQLNVIYSSWIHGVGSFAGGIFGCAEGDVNRALDVCVKTPEQINAASYVKRITALADKGLIDPVANLRSTRAFIFTGTKDTTVNPHASQKLAEMYQGFVASADQIIVRNTIPAEHGQPTLNYGNACDQRASPWLNNCNYDGAGATLWQSYGKLNSRGVMDSSHLRAFDQSEFGAGPASMAADGYTYVPAACAQGQKCRLHIALHGCEQSPVFVQSTYMTHAGYNEWAETNNIVILYPVASFAVGNPLACWDWWGYTGNDYLTHNGKQNQVIKNIVGRLYGK